MFPNSWNNRVQNKIWGFALAQQWCYHADEMCLQTHKHKLKGTKKNAFLNLIKCGIPQRSTKASNTYMFHLSEVFQKYVKCLPFCTNVGGWRPDFNLH